MQQTLEFSSYDLSINICKFIISARKSRYLEMHKANFKCREYLLLLYSWVKYVKVTLLVWAKVNRAGEKYELTNDQSDPPTENFLNQ